MIKGTLCCPEYCFFLFPFVFLFSWYEKQFYAVFNYVIERDCLAMEQHSFQTNIAFCGPLKIQFNLDHIHNNNHNTDHMATFNSFPLLSPWSIYSTVLYSVHFMVQILIFECLQLYITASVVSYKALAHTSSFGTCYTNKT